MPIELAFAKLQTLIYEFYIGQKPDLQIWLDIHDLAAKMCAILNANEAPKPTDA